jgi:hypothetical protein
MKFPAIPMFALSSIAALFCCAQAVADPPPPVCPVVKCKPAEFVIREKAYGCPKSIKSSAPINATLDCMSTSQHSVSCEAFPVEVQGTCGGSGINLIYDWTVKIGTTTYQYPPGYNNTLGVSCMSTENVYATVTVWNGTYSSTRSVGMRCGDDPN